MELVWDKCIYVSICFVYGAKFDEYDSLLFSIIATVIFFFVEYVTSILSFIIIQDIFFKR